MLNTVALEQLATHLRELLKLDTETILNPNHLEELSKKVEENLDGFKIETFEKCDGRSWLLLENEKNFTIRLWGDKETRFYDLVKYLSFAFILDRKSLNHSQLQHSEYLLPRLNGYEEEYLMLAFMIPRKALLSAITQYSSADNSTVNIVEMNKKVNKYCSQRAKDLHIW